MTRQTTSQTRTNEEKWKLFNDPKYFVELYVTAMFFLLCAALVEHKMKRLNIPVNIFFPSPTSNKER